MQSSVFVKRKVAIVNVLGQARLTGVIAAAVAAPAGADAPC
jgi:hypothetical protein